MSGDSTSKELSLKDENIALKNQLKELESKLEGLKIELETSNGAIPRLENLCSELKNQNTALKVEGIASIQNAEQQGKDLASEVSASMEFMQNVNSSLEKLTGERNQAQAENDELALKLDKLKEEHDPKEESWRAQLEEKCDELVKYRTELAQVRIQNAEDKERLFGEMQQLATTLIESREQLKLAKETELHLRIMLQNYDKKFENLQKSLNETNTAYDGFKGDMGKMCNRTKNLETDTTEWKKKWAESNASLKAAEEHHTKLQTEIAKAHEGLTKMTNLCRALQNERKELLTALKRGGE